MTPILSSTFNQKDHVNAQNVIILALLVALIIRNHVDNTASTNPVDMMRREIYLTIFTTVIHLMVRDTSGDRTVFVIANYLTQYR